MTQQTKQNHTPGPWILGDDPAYVGIPHTKAGTQWIRCIGEVNDVSDAEDEASARLIAAAPETAAERDRLKEVNAELLFLLERYVYLHEEDCVETDEASTLLTESLAAIAKATGKEAA